MLRLSDRPRRERLSWNFSARWMPSSSPAMTTKYIFRWPCTFLEAGLPVFVDKPLSLDISQLRAFKPYLEKGQLMSCSGMRYARELDEPRADLAAYGRLKLIRGAIVLSWEKYGVHLLEAAMAITPAHPVSVRMLPAEHASAVIRLDDGVLMQIDALGECPRTFHLELFGTQRTGAFRHFRQFLDVPPNALGVRRIHPDRPAGYPACAHPRNHARPDRRPHLLRRK